jgi:Lipocalin-like domain
MIRRFAALAAGVAAAFAIGSSATAQTPNNVVGTWRPISATLEINGVRSHPYGPEPQGMLVFTRDMHFVIVLRDPRLPRFASNERGQGTNEENRAAMAAILALYGNYTVDAAGNFSGNTVHGSNFPNWIGDVRTTKELSMVVDGNRMTENFQRPGGAKVVIVWERVKLVHDQPVRPGRRQGR